MAPPKKKSKVNLSHLRSLVHQEKAPTPLTADDIKNMMIPLSFKAHEYTMSLWADRPGEFIESGAWKHSDEGLLYGDIDLVRYQNGTYTGYLLYLWLRNRKGHRNNKKHFPIMLLYEEAGMRSMCLVTYFLALALADGVFDGCESFKDIEVKELPLGSLLYTYRYKSEAKQRPILRSINPNGTVSDNEILTYNCFNNMLKGIGQRAGYEDRLSAYWFRRAYAKAVEKTATPAQRRLFMGHTNDDTVMYYISGIVGVDSQSMVYRREQKSELIDENTSMMLKRNLLAPMPPGSQLTDRLSRNADLTDGPVVTLPERTPSQEYALRRQSRKVAYRKQRGDFFDGKPLAPEYAVTAPHQTASDSESTGSTPLRYPSRYLKALWKFEPERERIANLMYSYSRNSVAPNNSTAISRREIPLSDILQPMTKLAHPKKERYVYQSAGPTEDNCCSVCGHQFTKKSRPNHRFTQFDSAFDLHKHMKKHLAQLPPLSECLHPHCQSSLDSEAEFWSHAEDVHGMPPFGPRRATGKRKMPEDLNDMEDSTSDMNSGLQDCDNELQG
ncbi:hypothetical protein PTT_08526 [Pyrenophora teres f. teres 0-1]|uniref:Uncharacterized protein n=1 Tax=Pyrenophora teres f. teres (strain 0-1) TaxID=861557 RepID=E3RK07_PYRTT|nr:hypothetical protein PTT_08526 [Pyrenophora teres f. teres 0-1]